MIKFQAWQFDENPSFQCCILSDQKSVVACLDCPFVQSDLVGMACKLCKIYVQICNLKKSGPLSHLNGFHVFTRDNIRKAFTVMHNPVFEHSDTLSFALLACFILYIHGKQFIRAFSLLFSIYIIGNPNFIASICMGNPIRIQKVKDRRTRLVTGPILKGSVVRLPKYSEEGKRNHLVTVYVAE